MLVKKLFRTFGEYKAQFISMILMIMIGVGIFIGFNMEWVTIEKDTNAFYEETYFADYRVVNDGGLGFTEKDLKAIRAIEGVDAAALYASIDLNVKGEEKKTLAVTVTTSEDVSFFKLMSGAPYDKEDEDGIWLSERYAEENDIKIGDTITLFYNGDIPLIVRGLVKSAEYLICVPDNGAVMPSFDTYGFAYVSPAAYLSVAKFPIYPQINVRSSLPEREFKEAVNSALSKTTLVLTKDEVISYAEVQGEAKEGKTMGAFLPLVFLLIAVLTMITTMHRIAAKEKTQIGTLKALGFRDGTLLRHYTLLSLFVGIIGSILGIGLGYLVCYFIMNPHGAMGTYFDMPYWTMYLPWFSYLVIAVILALFTAVGYFSVSRMLKGSAAEALRPLVPKKVSKVLLEKTPLWNKLSFGMKWNLRDMMRHKSRLFMSLLGVIGCMVILVGAMGMKDTATEFIDSYYEGAMNYKTCIYLDTAASDAARDETITLYGGNYSATVPVEIEEKAVSLTVWSLPNDKMRFLKEDDSYVKLTDNEAFVCSRIADEFGLKKGDVIKISPFGKSKVYELTVGGVARSLSESIMISVDYAKALGVEYKADTIYSDTPITEVDTSLVAIKNVRTKGEIMESFDSFMEIMNEMILLLIVAGVILGVIVLYNLGSMGYTERYLEMATLKVVGFNNKKIAGLLIGQTMLITLFGILLGFPLGVLVLKWLIVALASEYEMSLYLGPMTYLVSILVTAGVSLIVGLLVARKNKKIDMVAALKAPE